VDFWVVIGIGCCGFAKLRINLKPVISGHAIDKLS